MKFPFYTSMILSTIVSFGSLPASAAPAKSVHKSSPPSLKMEKAKLDTPALYPKRSKLLLSVSHNEYFPPLPESLRPGSIFNEDNVVDPKASKEDVWYKVPEWITGEYSYGPINTYLEKNMQTDVEKKIDESRPGLSHGRQRGVFVDKVGNIWQKAYGGGIIDPSNPDNSTEFELKKYDDELLGYIVSPNQYVESSAGVEFYVRTSDRKIFKANRWERIRNFSVGADGAVSIDVSEEVFDIDGKPLMLHKSKGTMIKRAAFQPLSPGGSSRTAGDYGGAVRSLRKFMESNGSLAEAPDAPANETGSAQIEQGTQTDKDASGK